MDQGRRCQHRSGSVASTGRRQQVLSTDRRHHPADPAFLSDFVLEPDYYSLLLNWRERNSDQVFSVSQASDGMLRVIALVTLLLQYEPDLPDVLILDKPEPGLHPHAINVVGGLIRAAATKIKVIVATRSMSLVDCFEPTDIVIVEREDGGSNFRRLDTEALRGWLEGHSLSGLWGKNVIGGRPWWRQGCISSLRARRKRLSSTSSFGPI